MKKFLALSYGISCYLLFNGVFLYFIAFTGDFIVPKTVDSGVSVPLVQGLIVNLFLIALFGVQHSLMARPKFKQWWLKIIPISIERSTYVLFSSSALILLCWLWQPLPTIVWQITHPAGYGVLQGLFWFGWLLSLLATFLINHFDLLGIRQVYLYWQGQPYSPVPFREVLIYKQIRHPIMLGTLIGFWATPTMTVGHLLLALGFSGYIFIGIRFEEQDMLNIHGEFYQKYRQKTSMVMFPLWKVIKGGN
jgi:protein-S-isoprenylcysteine O-methyltransferase Ste14